MFKVGDICEAFGCRGKVIGNNPERCRPITVEFAGGTQESFVADGRQLDWHKEPSLKLIERPQEKIELTWEKIESEIKKYISNYAYSREYVKRALGFKE